MRAVLRTRAVVCVVALITLITPAALTAADSTNVSVADAPLSADQVVDNLIRRNQERGQALLHSDATRVYRLVYQGFPGDREAEMTVEASYDKPSSKEFKVISQSGSKLVLNRVFKKLMESEKEAAQPAMNAKTQLNRDNYTFELTGYEPSKTGRAIYIAGGSENRAASMFIVDRSGWMDRISRSRALKPNRRKTHRSGPRKARFITSTKKCRTSGFRSGMNRSAISAWVDALL